ncbi:hypothetical protein FBY14_10148 [Azospirillum brasilense]|nr:hypothetical protein FBY14_10148 [Azospirillum brasilense]
MHNITFEGRLVFRLRQDAGAACGSQGPCNRYERL